MTELTRRPRRPRRKRHLGSSSGDRPAPELPATRTWGPAAAVAAILGLLFLGVGLVVGGAFGADALVRSVSTDLERLEQATRDGQWDVAAAQAKALEGRLAGSSDAASLARLSEARAGIDAMLVYRAIPVSDPEARFDEAMELAQDSHPAVRAGIALKLRSFGDLDAAVECLVELSEDPDPRVVEAATRSIVHAGGPLAAPFLERTILATVPGDALGDVAVEQALRLEEPEATPALLAILKTRPDAKAPLLARTLRLLAEVGDGRACVEAAERFENHPAFDVKRAAEAVLDTLG